MARNRLPFVHRRQLRDGSFRYRGWAEAGGKRVFSRSYTDEDAAYQAALRLRGEAQNQVDPQSLEAACESLLDELRTKRTKKTLTPAQSGVSGPQLDPSPAAARAEVNPERRRHPWRMGRQIAREGRAHREVRERLVVPCCGHSGAPGFTGAHASNLFCRVNRFRLPGPDGLTVNRRGV